jgi:Ni/Co efflux regulator RcnB
MKRLLCAMATIAFLTGPVASAQPDPQHGQQQDQHGRDNRQADNRQAGQQQAAQRQNVQRQNVQRQAVNRNIANRQAYQRETVNRQTANRQAYQRQSNQQQANQRQAYRQQAYQRQVQNNRYNNAANNNRRAYNNGVRRGWAENRGNAYRWQSGERMGYDDWYNAPRVTYWRHHLRRPPYGYEWRRYDDRYVLVAVTTGLIASVILMSGR